MANISELTLKFNADTSNAIKEIDKLKDKTKDVTKKTNGIFSSIGKALKRIVLYRGIRSIISSIGNAIKTGVDNLYQFSKIGNGSFAQALDSMSTSVQYLTNSLGAALAPVIESLTPLITNIVDAMASFNNRVAQMFSYMNGKDTYLKATKSLKEYTKAANEAKTATIGLDELNIINNKNDNNFADMFEETPIDVEQAEKSRRIFEEIKGITIAIGAIWSTIKIVELIDKFKTLATVIKGISFSEGFLSQLGVATSGLGSILSIAKTGIVIAVEVAVAYYLFNKGKEAIDQAAKEEAERLAQEQRDRVDKIIENQKFDMSKVDANGNPILVESDPFDFSGYTNPNKIYDNVISGAKSDMALSKSASSYRENTILDNVMDVVNGIGEGIWSDIKNLFTGGTITIKNADGKAIADGVLESDNRYQGNLIGR